MVPLPLINLKFSKQKRHQLVRFSKYLVLAAIANGFIIGSSKNYINKTPPSYTSELVFNVAGAGGGVNVSLPDIGQATTSVASNFNSKSDPRENYKLLISGGAVKEEAAKLLKIDKKDLGEPRPSIIANTTTMKIEISAGTPEEAHERVNAVYEALSNRLDILRVDEQNKRSLATQRALVETQNKLASAQKTVSSYKLASGFISSDQIKELIQNIESLREKRAVLVSERSQVNDQIVQLSTSLKVTPSTAAEAITLQTDQPLVKSYSAYSQVSADLSAMLEYRGPNYPDVVELRKKQESLLADSLARANGILKRPIDQVELDTLLLENGNSGGTPRSELFRTLVDQSSQLKGIDGELGALQNQIKDLESRLLVYTQKEAVLDDYLRQLDIAEAVFAATLTKIDLGKEDLYASYPLTQVFEEATMPWEPVSPKPKLVYMGAIAAALFVTLGLTLGWYRNVLLEASRKIIRGIAE